MIKERIYMEDAAEGRCFTFEHVPSGGILAELLRSAGKAV
jgi:hypothetical protein